MLFITKSAQKNTIDSWRESGKNYAVKLIRQVQQLSHTREQKLSFELSHAFLCGERDSTENLCAAGEFQSGSSTNNQHVQKLTESWSEMALAIVDLDAHAKLCVVDFLSNEILYHENHLSRFNNR